jgi:serine/threonine-protein kinase HipA
LRARGFCIGLDLPTQANYSGTKERVAKAVRPLMRRTSSSGAADTRRARFAWLIADGDMHLKNIALLKTADPGDEQFRSVRIAPLYDAVTTRILLRLQHDRMALKLNGKGDHLRRADSWS